MAPQRVDDILRWLTGSSTSAVNLDAENLHDTSDCRGNRVGALQNEIAVTQVESDQNAVGDKFAKLQVLGDIIDSRHRRFDELFRFLQLENGITTYEDGQYSLNSFKGCMEALQKKAIPIRRGRSSNTPIPKTQWDNFNVGDMSSALYATLRRRLSRPFALASCNGHQAYLRLNGFDLEEKETPTSFDVFLSMCSKSNGWREGRCTSIHR